MSDALAALGGAAVWTRGWALSSTRMLALLLVGSALAACAAPSTAESPGLGPGPESGPELGVVVDKARLAEIAITVMSDGTGLPPGSGSAREGEHLYREHCQACHGVEGQGGPNDPLAGGRGSLDGRRPIKTIGSYWPYATTVFDYVRRAMPYPSPGALGDDELYSITAYLLHLNGLVDRDDVIDAETLPAIEMSNADGFDRAYEARP
jgi:cytochrome c